MEYGDLITKGGILEVISRCAIWDIKYETWNIEYGKLNTRCGMWDTEHGMCHLRNRI